jgi:hypothetical protein
MAIPTNTGLTGTYSFSPALSRLAFAAFGHLQLRDKVDAQTMSDAEMETNLLFVDWSNRQPNLWLSNLQTYTLTQGQQKQVLPIQTIGIQVVYISTTDSAGNVTDRVLGPISTVDYAAQPNKLILAAPTTYWFDRQITPQLWIWPTPDNTTTYTLNVRNVRQPQDASLPGGLGCEIPYRFNDAFVTGLAARLAKYYRPELLAILKKEAMDAYGTAANQDQEDSGVPIMISPGLQSYYRN